MKKYQIIYADLIQRLWKLKWGIYRRYLNRFRFVRGGLIRHRVDMSIRYVRWKFRIFGKEIWL